MYTIMPTQSKEGCSSEGESVSFTPPKDIYSEKLSMHGPGPELCPTFGQSKTFMSRQ